MPTEMLLQKGAEKNTSEDQSRMARMRSVTLYEELKSLTSLPEVLFEWLTLSILFHLFGSHFRLSQMQKAA